VDQAPCVQEVLPYVAFNVHFVFSHVADLAEHVASVLPPSNVLGERHSDLPENCVAIRRLLRVVDCVERHEPVLVREFGREHALKQLLHLALLARRNRFDVLEHADETWHALAAHQEESPVAELVDCSGLLVRILF